MKVNQAIRNLQYFTIMVVLNMCISSLVSANEKYSFRLSGLYEVANPYSIDDFDLGGDETIRDQDGTGGSIGIVIRRGEEALIELDMGMTQNVYSGTLEDRVKVTFTPQAGSGFEAVSSSTNVKYVYDMKITNQYLGVNFIWKALTLGGGRVFQDISGNGVTIQASGFDVIKAHYEPSSVQLYYQFGLNYSVDIFHFQMVSKRLESPNIVIDECNQKALGEVICRRINSVIENRNQSSNAFNSIMLYFGLIF